MSLLTQALYNELADDETLTDLLATYNDKPAIFTTEPVPGDASKPYIISAGAVAQEPNDTKTGQGRIVTRDIRCYAEADGSAETVEDIAERVRTLLHRQALDVSGYTCIITEASGPMAADEEDAYGRIVTIRVFVEKES